MHCLFAHAGALGKHGRTNPIGARKLENGHVWQLEILKPGAVKVPDQPTVYGLRRYAQQSPD
jgi:hypothetical protein